MEEKLELIKIELSVTRRMSSGDQHRNLRYAIFLLASLLFIYYILLILSHFSHHAIPYQSKGFGRPPFWGLILIGNCCRGQRGMREMGEEERREGRDRRRNETDREMTT